MPEYYIQPVTNRQECFQCHKTVTGKRKFSKCSRCHAITYCGKECQVADWKRHSWNCVPVMVTEYEGKGRGLVAAKDVKMGELLFIDKLAIQMPLDKFGLPDSGAVDSLMKQIKKLPSEARKLFYQMEPTSDPFNLSTLRQMETVLRNLKFSSIMVTKLSQNQNGSFFSTLLF